MEWGKRGGGRGEKGEEGKGNICRTNVKLLPAPPVIGKQYLINKQVSSILADILSEMLFQIG